MGILKKILPGLLVFALCLTGCGKQDNGLVDNSDGTNKNTSNVDFAENDEEMFTNRDKKSDYSQSSAVKIQLKDSTATASSDAVEISGTTIKITEEATYIIEGSLNDGMIVVDAPESAKLQIVLNGVKITSKSSAPLYIKEADKVVVTLADGTENSFENAGEFIAIDDNNIDGAVFSKQDLSFNGKGSLTVTSPAGHGIVCKDDLAVANSLVEFNVVYAREGVFHVAKQSVELFRREHVHVGVHALFHHFFHRNKTVAHFVTWVG